MSRFIRENKPFVGRIVKQKSFNKCQTNIIIPSTINEHVNDDLDYITDHINDDLETDNKHEVNEIEINKDHINSDHVEFVEIYDAKKHDIIEEQINPANTKYTKKDLFKLIVEQVIINKKKENYNGWCV
jgi:hypothetical protein